MGNKLSIGSNPLAYMGVKPVTPAQVFIKNRAPTANDYHNYNVTCIWLVKNISQIFMLTSKSGGTATWTEFVTSGGGDDIESLIGDNTIHTTPDAAGDVTIEGDGNISTRGAVNNKLYIDLEPNVTLAGNLSVGGDLTVTGDMPAIDDITVNGTIEFTSLAAGIMRTDAAGTVTSTNGGDGEILIGGGTGPTWSTITEGAGITVINTPGNIKIAATSGDNDLLVGTMIEYEFAVPPTSSWLQCDGVVLSQATYADLYSVIGHTFYLGQTRLATPPPTLASAIVCNKMSGADKLWVCLHSFDLYTSPDGDIWTKVFTAPGTLLCAAYNGLPIGTGGMWVIGGAQSKVYTSTDLIVWTQVDVGLTPSYHCECISYNGTYWMVGSYDGEYSLSTDGITWVAGTTGLGLARVTNITSYNNDFYCTLDRYYSFGTLISKGTIAKFNPIGCPFVNVYTAVFETIFNGITASASLIVAITQGSKGSAQIINSVDGEVWEEVDKEPVGINNFPLSIDWSDDEFLMSFWSHQKLLKTNDFENYFEIDFSGVVAAGGYSNGVSGNGESGTDVVWVATIQGVVSPNIICGITINPATEFYLPNKPGYIILF